MIKASIKSTGDLPKINLSNELKYIAEKIIIPDIAGHIQEGKDITGKKYRPLAPATIRDKGHERPLIGKQRRLFSSSTYDTKSKGKNKKIINIKPIRRKEAHYLQVEGVKSKAFGGRRRFNFFGVSKNAEKKSIRYLAAVIRKLR